MKTSNNYNFSFGAGTIKQEDSILSIVEGRLVPRDLSQFTEITDIDNAYLYAQDESGEPTKILVTDIMQGIEIFDTLPAEGTDKQKILLKVGDGKYEMYGYIDGAWTKLHIMSDADIVSYTPANSNTITTVQGAIDDLDQRVREIISLGNVNTVNSLQGDVLIRGGDDKIFVSEGTDSEGNPDIEITAPNLATITQLNTKAEAEREIAKEYADIIVDDLSDDVYHKSDIKSIAITGEAVDVHVNTLPQITSNQLQEVLRQINMKSGSGGSVVVTSKLDTPTSGYLASYRITLNGEQTGVDIDIPKDYLVKSGSIGICSVADVPVSGYAVGDRYLDLIINTKDNTGTDSHVYILMKDLMCVGSDGSKIKVNVNNNVISAEIKAGTIELTDLVADVQTRFAAVETKAASNETAITDINTNKLPLKANQTALETLDNSLATVAKSGSYDDLSNVLEAGEGIEITKDSEGNNIISNTNLSAVWGNVQGQIANQTDLMTKLDEKVDKVSGKVLSSNDYTNTEKTKLAGIETGAQVNKIETVDENNFEITDKELVLKTINISKVNNLSETLNGKVNIESGKALVPTSEITKLSGVSAGANKVEASTSNGYIKIDGTETKVYTEVANTVHDADYKHIDVTNTSVTDGTNTLTKYDDTALAGRVTTIEGKEATWNAKQDAISDLATIRSGAALGATSIQSHQSLAAYRTSANQDIIDNEAKNRLSAIEGKEDDWDGKQDAISDLSTIRSNATAGKDASDTIESYGNIVTHNTSEFATAAQGTKADTAVQPAAISDMATQTWANGTFLKEHQSLTAYRTSAAQDIIDDTFALDSELTTEATTRAAADTALQTSVSGLTTRVTTIEGKVPTAATTANQLADKAFVNSSVQAMASDYITANVSGASFATHAALVAGPYYKSGSTITPKKTDYAMVAQDEDHDNSQCRYTYDGTNWAYQYSINTTFTAVQQAAIDSGITSALVGKITTNENNITNLTTRMSAAESSVSTLETTKATTSALSAHTGNVSNPHSVTKSQVGLGSVINTGDSSTPVSGGTTKFTTGGAYTLKSTLETSIGNKVDKVSGYGLSKNDFTDTLKTKLDGIAEGANVKTYDGVTMTARKLTQAEYDALTTKDTNTLYITQ